VERYLTRTLKAALLASMAAAIPLACFARGRPGVSLACAGALAISLAAPKLGRRLGIPLRGLLEVVWLLPFAACWGLGEGLALFEKIPWWDALTHAIGGMAVFALSSSWGELRLKVPLGALYTLSVLMALAAGALWEIGEFASDSFLGTFTQSGNTDTMLDLIFDLGGAVAAALARAAFRRKNAWGWPGRAAMHPLAGREPAERVSLFGQLHGRATRA
jgi:hypothetical protein